MTARKTKPPTADPPVAENGVMRDLWVPGEADTGDEVDLGQHLLGEGAISRETLDAARRVVRQTPGLRLETCLLNKGADERVVYGALAAMSGVPLQEVASDDGDPGALERLGLEFCQMRHALPLGTRPVSYTHLTLPTTPYV